MTDGNFEYCSNYYQIIGIINIFICLIVHLFLLYLDEININK